MPSIADHILTISVFVCLQVTPAQLKASGINPRTKQPYVRGAYQTAEATATTATQIAAQKREAKAAEAKLAAASKSAADKQEIARLNAEVTRLTEALKAAEDKIELTRSQATLEASQASAEKMLQRYRDGLRDGASLSRGQICNLASEGAASSTPSSAAGHTCSGSSPSFGF